MPVVEEPSALDKTFILLRDRNGLDKVSKFFQFFSLFCYWCTGSLRLLKLSQNISFSRQWMRIGRSFQSLLQIQRLLSTLIFPQNENANRRIVWELVFSVVSCFGDFLFFITDHMLWLMTIGVLSADWFITVDIISNLGWGLSALALLIIDFIRILPPPSSPPVLYRRFFGNFADLILSLFYLRWCLLSDATVGMLGCLTAAVDVSQLWPATEKKDKQQ